MTKIAALIIAHKYPESLSRLLGRLSGTIWARYLHLDRKTDLSDFAGVIDSDVHMIEKRYRVHWGGFG
jgi:hypothetical protein